MSRTNIHIVPDGIGWAVKRAGVEPRLSRQRTQSAAENAGRTTATVKV
ncbi:MAG TPA: DUF2188 domain-containing protein [Phycisphaerales bacterium]|nr:DUF2188 domain-containing protein [Phycisphaerales bacterium]HMP38714.1 DUF2188 domain-containing protein [Phycisphaerales bacterium]